jgi:hypothetical protein
MNNTIFVAPRDAFVTHQTDAPVVAIKPFERGYYPIYTLATPDDLNRGRGITREIMEAAVVGSMSGWNVPGAKAAVTWAEAREKEEALG